MNDNADLLTIGQVTGVHGLGGNIKVRSFAESVDTFCPGRSVLLTAEDDTGQRYTILKAIPQRKGILLLLEGIDNRELAEDLVGKKILIDRAQLPEPEEDTWYWQDLLGLDVFDDQKGYIGKITDIIPTGANDVLVVTGKIRETLVPMHKHFIDSVDIEAGTVRTTLPEDY
ncbi:ribosome maturation factor RimM [Desulfobacula sp.]|uniref:ribosome maturation factor RimM n=1 Tax=Desulfobacula sp. TaxID=2593537 RepID=UPI002622EF25|nr:ribosome maturation factor RimM [Desulfobacula sp.]